MESCLITLVLLFKDWLSKKLCDTTVSTLVTLLGYKQSDPSLLTIMAPQTGCWLGMPQKVTITETSQWSIALYLQPVYLWFYSYGYLISRMSLLPVPWLVCMGYQLLSYSLINITSYWNSIVSKFQVSVFNISLPLIFLMSCYVICILLASSHQ